MSKTTTPAPTRSSSSALDLKVAKLPSESLVYTNFAYISTEDAKALSARISTEATPLTQGNYLKVKNFVFTFQDHKNLEKGAIGFSNPQRRCLEVSLGEPVSCKLFKPKKSNIFLSSLKLEVDLLSKANGGPPVFEAKKLEEIVRRNFTNQFFTVGQKFVSDVNSVNVMFTVLEVQVVDLEQLSGKKDEKKETKSKRTPKRGLLVQQSELEFAQAGTGTVKITGNPNAAVAIFRPDFNFEKMGIGGLDKEIADIFRRAFASRVFPREFVTKLGIKHVKGLLLYGPPGTGKTLIARQIGKMLNAHEPKIVNGPEILNKFVGQSEENIRNLFKDAEEEYKKKGDESNLHIIIFDELDAICKERGARNTGTGVGDSVVNQLLAKLDGVEEVNNVLVIGMTNRKELIDEALLRPGRLEVHMEIGLPDEKGRHQILKIKTLHMQSNNMIGPDVDLMEISLLTKNFSGAELEGLVRSASSFALQRQIDPENPTKTINPETIKVMREDFMRALSEVKPNFGVSEDDLEMCISNGVISYGDSFDKLYDAVKLFVQQVKNSDRTPLVSVLLEGPTGSGKTALSAKLAMESDFPYVKLLSPESLVGYNEMGKAAKISKVFEDAYKSQLSLIIVDDIERLLEFTPIGPRFSNLVLQTLLVLFKKAPPKGRKLLVIGTTSTKEVLKGMELTAVFNAVLQVPSVSGGNEAVRVLRELGGFSDDELSRLKSVFKGQLPVKKLIMIAEMALQSTNRDSVVERFIECMADYGESVDSFDSSVFK